MVISPAAHQPVGDDVCLGRISTGERVPVHFAMNALSSFLKAKIFKTKETTIGQTLSLYLSESWNKLDALCVIMYLASITLETYNTKMTLNAARYTRLCSMWQVQRRNVLVRRAFLAVDVVLWFIRLLVLLMIDRTVGPMLLMIQAMVGVVCAWCGLILPCMMLFPWRIWLLIHDCAYSDLFSSMTWSHSSRSSSSSHRPTEWRHSPYWRVVNHHSIWPFFDAFSMLLTGKCSTKVMSLVTRTNEFR